MAVSGGTDSICLLHLLRFRLPFTGRIVVVHVDHMLRDESGNDAAFVESVAVRWGLPFVVRQVDTLMHKRLHHMGIETAARVCRYRLLRSVAAESEATAILLGHTADDQAETIAMHLFRGSGLEGLAGMRLRNGDLLRPLLKVWRAETSRYCEYFTLETAEDSSNQDLSTLRNRIRLEVLPSIEAAVPQAREALLRLGDIASRDNDYLEAEVRAALPLVMPGGTLSPRLWSALSKSLAFRIAKKLAVESHNTQVTSHEVQEEVARLREAAGPSLRNVVLPLHRFDRELTLRAPARVVIGDLEFDATVIRNSPEVQRRATVASAWEAYLGFHDVSPVLTLRAWKSGDRMWPFGAPGTRKLQDIFVDKRVPQEVRSSVVVVESQGKIIWLAGLLMGETAKLTKSTSLVVHLRVRATDAKHNHFVEG